VSEYGLDEREIGVRSLAGVKEFSSNLRVHTGSEAYTASCTMGTGGPSPGAKHGRGVTLTTHPHLETRKKLAGATAPLPFGTCMTQRNSFYFTYPVLRTSCVLSFMPEKSFKLMQENRQQYAFVYFKLYVLDGSLS
jgi:hypothetical protein